MNLPFLPVLMQRRLDRLRQLVELDAARPVIDKELALIARDLDQLDEAQQERIRETVEDLGLALP